MTQLQELRAAAKKRGIKQFSTKSEADLCRALQVETVLRKTQVSVATQTDYFPPCEDCEDCEKCKMGALNDIAMHLSFIADLKEQRIIATDDGLEVDVETGEVLPPCAEHDRYWHRE